jgi:hypothetical protein
MRMSGQIRKIAGRAKRRLVMGLILWFGLMPGFARPARAVTGVQKGEAADAYWYPSDRCVMGSVALYAAENVTLGSNPAAAPFVDLSTSLYDGCTGASSWSATGSYDIRFTGKGTDSASLTGTIYTYGCECDAMSCGCPDHTVDVNINWTATGKVTRVQVVDRTQGPAGLSVRRFMGFQAPAAAAGILKRDGVTDLISASPQSADIYSNDLNTISVGHP